jgi:hypothetical protein
MKYATVAERETGFCEQLYRIKTAGLGMQYGTSQAEFGNLYFW